MRSLRTQRPSARRILRGVLVGAAFVAVGVVAAVIGSRLAVGGVTRYRSPGPLYISADGLTLAASGAGGCGGGVLEARETARTVTVRLRAYPDVMIAPGVCAIRSFVTTLNAPLGDRRLVDGVTNETLIGFDGKGMLRPTTLPPGYAHRYDTAAVPTETVHWGQSGAVQIYSGDDSYDETLWIEQAPGAQWQPPAGVVEQPVTVRGHPGTAIAGEIEWTENGQLLVIRSVTYAYATLSTAQLVAVAESLR
jgi:hypothetical protein